MGQGHKTRETTQRVGLEEGEPESPLLDKYLTVGAETLGDFGWNAQKPVPEH